jgi:hypothetical protein
MPISTALAETSTYSSLAEIPPAPTPTRSLTLVRTADPKSGPEPSQSRGAHAPTTQTITVVEFTCQLTVTDAREFRYRYTLTHARRTIRGLWTYAEVNSGSLRVAERWRLLYPEAASASVEVEGGIAGQVQALRVESHQEPWGPTFAVDAV